MNITRLLSASLALAFVLATTVRNVRAADDEDEVSAERHRGRGPRVIVYERPGFGGAFLEVELDSEVLDLSMMRFPNGSRVNDKISSIEISRGAQVKIYADDGFGGEFLELARSVENLAELARAGGQNWNDAISSFRVFESRHGRPRGRDPSRTPRIIVFSRDDYHGEAFEIFPGEKLDNLNRERFDSGTDLNDEISSIRVVGSLRVRLYFDTRYGGEYIDITADTSDLERLRRTDPRKNWNDKASSLVVEWVGPPRKLDDEPGDDIDDRADDVRDRVPVPGGRKNEKDKPATNEKNKGEGSGSL